MAISTKKRKAIIFRTVVGVVSALCLLAIIGFIHSRHFAVLEPQGIVAARQRQLMIFGTLLSLAIIVPVFALTFHIVRTYRVGANKKARYTPDWDHDRRLETLWWGIPSVIIVVLSVVTWQTSHELSPSRPLVSEKPALNIQVIAMEWKWLFIYPEQGIATVNYVKFPADRPVNFQLTADAPMNSFWIPELGGQIYAMSGMSTNLYLMADRQGSFQGSSANLSGKGFAGMRFQAEATSDAEFSQWVLTHNRSGNQLDIYAYTALAEPSSNNLPATFQLSDKRLYDTVIRKYMGHRQPAQSATKVVNKQTTDSTAMEGMTMDTHMERHNAGN